MSMRVIGLLLPVLLLTACGGQEDMDEYVQQTKARKPTPIEPLPEIKPFSPMAYQRSDQRSPFIEPQPETSSRVDAKTKPDCAQIVASREKEVLER